MSGPLLVAAAAMVSAFAAPPSERSLHPLHTTLTEVTIDPARHTMQAIVRVFDDDLAHAVAPRATSAASDAQAITYVAAALRISENGAALPLRSCGVRRSGDLLWVCVEATTSAASRAIEMRNALLCELYSDQVNIVQVNANGSKKSVLFTRGDGPKRLL